MDNASAAEANLRWLLRPMEALLADPAMTDLYINGPGEGRCFVDRGHGMERITLPYTFDDLEDIAINAAALTRQDIAEDVPLVSTRFPGRAAGADRPSSGGRRRAVRLLHPPAQAGDLDTGRSGARRRVRQRRRAARTAAATTANGCCRCIGRGNGGAFLELAVAAAAQHRVLRHGGFGQDAQSQGLHARDPAPAGGW